MGANHRTRECCKLTFPFLMKNAIETPVREKLPADSNHTQVAATALLLYLPIVAR